MERKTIIKTEQEIAIVGKIREVILDATRAKIIIETDLLQDKIDFSMLLGRDVIIIQVNKT